MYDDVDAWEEKRDEVNQYVKAERDSQKYDMADDSLRILEELTGTNDYPFTKSVPPIIFDVEYGPSSNAIYFYISSKRAGHNFWLDSRLDSDGIQRLSDLDGVTFHELNDV